MTLKLGDFFSKERGNAIRSIDEKLGRIATALEMLAGINNDDTGLPPQKKVDFLFRPRKRPGNGRGT